MKMAKRFVVDGKEWANIYEHGNYLVVIYIGIEYFAAYLTGRDRGDVELMFEAQNTQQTADEFRALIEKNLDAYIRYYEAREQERREQWQTTKAN